MRESTASTASTGETFFFAIAAARSDADIQQRPLSFMVPAIVCCPGHAHGSFRKRRGVASVRVTSALSVGVL